MFATRNAKRLRAVAIALSITILTNYAISFAAKANGGTTISTPQQFVSENSRSGGTTPGSTPRPMTARSGGTTPGSTPKP